LKTLDEKKGLVFLEAEGGHVTPLTQGFRVNCRCTLLRNF